MLRRPSPPQPPVSASLPGSRSKSPHPCVSTLLAAYREAEMQGAVQVRAPKAAAPQACTAQAAVRTRLPARPRGGRGVVGAAGPGMQGSRAARPVHPAPQLLPGRPPASGTAQQSQPRGAATRGRRNAADSAPSESSARSSHAPRPRRAAPPCGQVRRCACWERDRPRPTVRNAAEDLTSQPTNHILAGKGPALT